MSRSRMAFMALAIFLSEIIGVKANPFGCISNGITPEFLTDSLTFQMPHIFVGDDIYRDVFVELIPDEGNFSEGRYRLLITETVPQRIQCYGFTQSNECPGLEELMCN